jgi:hypothetical protein
MGQKATGTDKGPSHNRSGVSRSRCSPRTATSLRRARSRMGTDPRKDEWPETFAFCPESAEGEFGRR